MSYLELNRTAEKLAVPHEAKQFTINLSGSGPGSVELGSPRKVIWVLAAKEVFLNVSRGAVPGNLSGNGADNRRLIIPANFLYPIPQQLPFDTVHAAIADGSGTARVLIQVGQEVDA